MKKVLLLMLVFLPLASFAQTGEHSVTLIWQASSTAGVTYNIYRGTAAGVCSGTPTPFATGISTTTYTDMSVTNGQTLYYNVSAVNSGGESACNGEIQVRIPVLKVLPMVLM